MNFSKYYFLLGIIILYTVFPKNASSQSFSPSSSHIISSPIFTSGLNKAIRCDVQKSSGKVVYSWTEYDATYAKEIFCAIYDKDMNLLVSPFRVNKNRTNDQTSSSLKVNQQDNSFAITWTSYQNGSTDPDIYVKKISFDADFSQVGNTDDLLVNNITAGIQLVSTLLFDYTRNELLVSIRDYAGADGDAVGAFFRRINYFGNNLTASSFIGNQIQINQYFTNNQYIVDWAISPVTGELITICEGYLNTSTLYDVVKRVWTFNISTNTWVGATETCVNNITGANQQPSSIVINSITGDYIVGWGCANVSASDGSGWTAYSKVFNKNHSVIKNDFWVNAVALQNQIAPKAIWDETTNIISYFFLYAYSGFSTIKYRHFDASNNYAGISTDIDLLTPETTKTNWSVEFYPVYNPTNHMVYLAYDLWDNYASNSIGKARKFEYLNSIFNIVVPYSVPLGDGNEDIWVKTLNKKLYLRYEDRYISSLGTVNYKILDYKRNLAHTGSFTRTKGGINSFIVDLSASSLIVGKNYTLEVMDAKNKVLKVRFNFQ